MLIELTTPEIEDVLSGNQIGRIGCSNGTRIHILPVNYIYQKNAVLCQSYEGGKVAMMREHPAVCFEVEDIFNFNNWRTVLAWGTFEELSLGADIDEARVLLSDTWLAQKASLSGKPPAETTTRGDQQAHAIVYYRIKFDELSGRLEQTL